MSLRSKVARVRRNALCAFARRNVLLPCDRSLISFSFDDFPRTALTVGGAILKNAGARGTYYAAPGLMDSLNELGPQFRMEDLQDLLTAGHELASHTYSHAHARCTSLARYREEVERGFRTLKETFRLNASRQFAYPYGEITFWVKKTVGPMMQSCRGVYPGLNGPILDLNLLRANDLYGNTDQLAAARTLIDENSQRRTWLIFYTHDVQPNPSPYGCTPELLEQVVRTAVESGSRIATISDVISLVQS